MKHKGYGLLWSVDGRASADHNVELATKRFKERFKKEPTAIYWNGIWPFASVAPTVKLMTDRECPPGHLWLEE